ncbi:MAG: LamG-like jellyroll fold domain-containing protein [Candidatus Promineifilaceae bacterium]
MNYKTNPFSADSDSDGLNDYIETVTGWLVVYKNYDQPYLTRVWSDPNSPDADGDNMKDLDEFIFGFHPQVTSDPNDVSGLVQFNNLEVVENSHMVLLNRFEESSGADLFFDSSGAGHNATCDRATETCPVAEVNGRYQHGLNFDGVNDYLSAPSLVNPGIDSFTAALWFNIADYGSGFTLLQQNNGSGTGRTWLDISAGGRLGTALGANPNFETITTDEWHHAAVTSNGITVTLYLDGQVLSSATAAPPASDGTMLIGVNKGFGGYFHGQMDEVTVLDRALSGNEVQALMNGRYNPNDLILAPGTELTYRATVTNTSATTTSGFLLADTGYVEPEIPRPAAAFSFEPDQKRSFFHNEKGEENSIACLDNGSCPAAGTPGKFGSSIAFDGVDDYAELPALGTGGHMHFWLWIDSLPPAGKTAAIIDTADELENDFDLILNDTGQLIIEIDGTPIFTAPYDFSSHLNEWVHVSIKTLRFYINGNNVGSPGFLDNWRVGYGRLGNSLDGSAPFDGRIDEFVSLDADDGSGGGISYNEIKQHIMNGQYEFTNGNPAQFHTYDFLYRFDELIDYDGTIFYDSLNANHATCSGATCPALTDTSGGYNGRAAVFDGVDDYLTQPGSFSTDEDGNVTVSFYVKMSAYPSSNAYIFDTASGTDVLDMYITPAGKFVATREEGTHTSSGSIPLNQWVEVRLQYAKFYGSCWTYLSRIYFDNVFDSDYTYKLCSNPTTWDIALTIGSGRIGNSMAGTNPFGGSLDSIDFAVSSIDFDPPSADAGFDNLANDIRAASCDDVFLCPSVASGRFDQGLRFDGVEEYLRLDKVLDPAAGNFTAAIWFNVSDLSDQPIILAQTDGDGVGRTWLSLLSDGRLSSNLGGSTLVSTAGVTTNNWHHAAITFDGVTERLYLDGLLQGSATRTMEANNGDMWLGRHKVQTDRYFNGLMDELVILPAAVNGDGVQMLMNSTWPAIDIPALFETFSAPALTNLEVSGTAEVNPYAQTSLHQFDQEIEAALQLQSHIDYPIIDDNAANLVAFFPFEDTPGSTSFENLITYDNDTYDVEATCTGNSCPTAGLRGQVDRAAYFDGLNDYLTLDVFNLPGVGGVRTFSAWLNGKQGTILNLCADSCGRAWELDMNRLYERGGYQTIPLDLPKQEWFHLAVTVDFSGLARVYVNGSEIVSGTLSANFGGDLDRLMIGSDYVSDNQLGQDVYEGYMDDLRLYSTILSANDIQTLYEESAPVMRFEFDEDSNASAFVDNSVNKFVGQPAIQTCAALNLDSLSINSLAETPSSVFVALDDERLLNETDRIAGDSLAPDIDGILCGQQSLSVGVSANGTPTTLGTVNLDVANPGTAVQTFSAGGNSIQLTWTVDSMPIYRPNPTPGTSGRIANGALFDGEGFITITETVPLNLNDHDFTIAAWIKTTASDVGILIKDDGDNNWEPGEKAFYLDGSGYPTFATQGNFMRAGTAVNDDHWHYVVAVWNYGGGSFGESKVYIDGLDATTIDTYIGTWPDNPGDTLKIGGKHPYSTNFIGQIDELVAYRRALTEAELYSIYLREIRWYRDRTTSYLTVDTDAPIVALLSDATYRPNGYTQLAVATTDPTSYVALLDFGLKAPGQADFTWWGAPQCQDNGTDGAAWCPFFDTTTLGGEGKYQVQFRAVDAVGNEATSAVYTFYIDDTPPTVSGNYTGQWGTITDQDDKRLNWTVALTGTIGDPDLSITPVVAGSGLVTNSVQVTLVDAAGGLIGEGAQQAAVNGSDWIIDYKMTGARPQGTYTITVNVEDKVGNTAETTLGTVHFDERPPRVTFNRWEINDLIISDTVTLNGAVSDQADWGGEVASYAFEEVNDATIFYDDSENGVHLNCANCPTVVSNGRFGRSLHFDGVDDVLSTYTGTNTPFDNQLTLSGWIKPDSLDGIDRIITLGNGAAGLFIGVSGDLRFLINIDSIYYEIAASDILLTGQWQHIAGSYDGQTIRLYHNGIEVSSYDVAGELDHTMTPLAGMFFGGAAEPYGGQMDEMNVYNRALSSAEIYALAQQDESGIQSVEIGLEPIDFSEGLTPFASPAWYSATITNGSWNYTIPTDTEGLYNIHLRSTDNFDNVNEAGVVWRGVLDTKAPQILASGQHIGSGSASQTLYTFIFSDFILDEASFDQPCGENELVSQRYDDSLLPQNGMAYEVTATCRVPGHEDSRDFTVCDTVGHCTTQTVYPAVISEDEDSIAILNPINLSNVEQGSNITISGGAFDTDSITSIVVRVNGSVIDTIPVAMLPDTTWSTNWTPTMTGTVTVAAAMNDMLGNTITDTIQLNVESGTPTAVTLQSGVIHPSTNLPFVLILILLLALATIGLWWRREENP